MLRQQYVQLLPEIRQVAWELETEIRHQTLRISQSLQQHEQIVVKSRVKDCESAITTLRGLSPGRVFDPGRKDEYSLLDLPDLAGVRVLVFPNSRLAEVHSKLSVYFSEWTPKPIKNDQGILLAHKYYGYFAHLSTQVRGEYQVVPMLQGLFWDVEHSAMYKSPALSASRKMRKLRSQVETALSEFEQGIAEQYPDNSQPL